jgi:hypothetical protein
MKLTLMLIVFLVMGQLAYSQKYFTVKGSVSEAGTTNKLQYVSVSILNAKDSIQRAFTHTSSDGSFSIAGLQEGNYMLLVSFPDLVDYVEVFQLDSLHHARDFGDIKMELRSKLLSEVIVKARKISMRMKGDTTEFDAGYFKIRPNAKVEDLLKQLPGVQIDNTGKITAQGKIVNKVLVDGEEFFGDDPTLVTRNLRADMIDKVQVYDKKSDKSTFTGIDDGVRNKTINLKLREDKKNGYFGKLDGGVGTGKFYQTQAMFNAFRSNEKFSIYGTHANTGKIGLGFQDNQKYIGGLGAIDLIDAGSVSVFSFTNNDLDAFDGRYNGEGIPKVWNAGVHYDNKWNNNKQILNTNYKAGMIDVSGEKNTLVQNNLSSGTINSTDVQRFDNRLFRQKADAAYQHQIDSTSTIKIMVDANSNNSNTNGSFLSSSRRGNDLLLNSSSRSIKNDLESKAFHASAFWSKRFKRPGRTLIVAADESYQTQNSDGNLKSDIRFFGISGGLDSTQTIDQLKVNRLKSAVLKVSGQYTEPLSSVLSLSVNYVFSLNNSSSDRRSYNAGATGYTLLDTLYSSHYKFDQVYNQAGFLFNYRKNKNALNFGLKAAAVNYKQSDLFTTNQFNRNFINWNPQVIYNLQLASQRRFSVSYVGNTNQPTLEQLQPARINTDPLNITVGNPELKPSFSNAFRISYETYSSTSDHFMSITGTYGLITNPIASNTTIDSAGKSTYQAINLNRNSANFSGEVFNSWKIKDAGLNIGLSVRASGNEGYNLVNNITNLTQTANYGVSVSASKYKDKAYDFNVSFGPSYLVNKSSLQDINGNGWGFRGNGGFNLYLPWKLKVGTEGNYSFSGKTESFNEDFERFIINVAFTKSFAKNNQFNIILQGNDLLNQNQGFSRFAADNRLTQTTYTTIRRYFLLSFTWDFNKMSTASPTYIKR